MYLLPGFTPYALGTLALISSHPSCLTLPLSPHPLFSRQVLDIDIMLKLERRFLLEVPAELSGLLEPVTDPEARLKLLGTNKLQLEELKPD